MAEELYGIYVESSHRPNLTINTTQPLSQAMLLRARRARLRHEDALREL